MAADGGKAGAEMAWLVRWGLIASAVAWLAGIALAGMLAADGARVALLATGLALLTSALPATVALGRRPRAAPLLAALWLGGLLLLGMARLAWQSPQSDPLNIVHAGFGRQLEFQGTVSGEPDDRAKGSWLTVQVTAIRSTSGYDWQRVDGVVQVFASGAPDQFTPQYGDTVDFTGVLAALPYTLPGVDASAGVASVTVTANGGGNPALAAIFALRQRMAVAIQHALPAPEAALLIGIVLGLKTPVLRQRLPLFTRTGTIHLVVTSGLKVTLVGDLAARMTRPLGRVVSTGLALFIVSGYVVLSGAGPAAIRAGVMGVLLILSRFAQRPYDALRALALTAIIMTLASPATLWDVGFQLSASGTLGIIILGERLRAPLVAWMGRWRGGAILADALAGTIAAQISTLPIVAIAFGIVSLIAPLTNMVLVPLLPVFVGVGALIGFGGLIAAPIGTAIGFGAWPVLRLADLVVEGGAALPFAALTTSGIPGWVTPVWVAGIGAIPAVWRQRPVALRTLPGGVPLPWQMRAGFVGMLAVVLLTCGAGSVALAPMPLVRVTFLDTGAGGPATLVQLRNGPVILLDGGASGPALTQALATALPFWQRRIDLVVVTDVRDGHIAGLLGLLGAYQIGQVVDPGALHPTRTYAAWYADLVARGTPPAHLRTGAVMTPLPGVQLTALNPPAPLVDGANQQDTNALVVLLQAPGLRMIFAGDASDLALAQVAYQGDLHADIVQICQLPQESILPGSGWADLLRLAHPSLVVIQPSARPAIKGLPASPPQDDPQIVVGMTVARTWQTGPLSVAGDGVSWWLSAGESA